MGWTGFSRITPCFLSCQLPDRPCYKVFHWRDRFWVVTHPEGFRWSLDFLPGINCLPGLARIWFREPSSSSAHSNIWLIPSHHQPNPAWMSSCAVLPSFFLIIICRYFHLQLLSLYGPVIIQWFLRKRYQCRLSLQNAWDRGNRGSMV